MNEPNKREYWDERANLGYKYKGETFYTITPIPYYYKRRKLLLQLLTKYLSVNKQQLVCDYGCGDGWYLGFFENNYPKNKYYGIDMSESMLISAKKRCKIVSFDVSEYGINFQESFDLVYSIAVFAHILDDKQVISLFKNIYEKIDDNGKFIFFEQTGETRTQGDKWTRRTQKEYMNLALKAGFNFELKTHIRFDFHVFFEKVIAKLYYQVVCKRNSLHSREILANNSQLFRALSALFVMISIRPIKRDDNKKSGNTLFVFNKNIKRFV